MFLVKTFLLLSCLFIVSFGRRGVVAGHIFTKSGERKSFSHPAVSVLPPTRERKKIITSGPDRVQDKTHTHSWHRLLIITRSFCDAQMIIFYSLVAPCRSSPSGTPPPPLKARKGDLPGSINAPGPSVLSLSLASVVFFFEIDRIRKTKKKILNC